MSGLTLIEKKSGQEWDRPFPAGHDVPKRCEYKKAQKFATGQKLPNTGQGQGPEAPLAGSFRNQGQDPKGRVCPEGLTYWAKSVPFPAHVVGLKIPYDLVREIGKDAVNAHGIGHGLGRQGVLRQVTAYAAVAATCGR